MVMPDEGANRHLGNARYERYLSESLKFWLAIISQVLNYVMLCIMIIMISIVVLICKVMIALLNFFFVSKIWLQDVVQTSGLLP